MRPPRSCPQTLLDWTLRLATLPMAQTSQVEGRLTAILRSPKRGEVARRAALIAGLLVAVFLGGLAVLRVTLRLPATVDASTPLAQGGFTLLAVQRGDGSSYRLDINGPQGEFHHTASAGYGDGLDSTALWMQPPALPHASTNVTENVLLKEYKEYSVRVRASTGAHFTLPCNLADNGYPTGGRPPLVCVAIPPGYPDSYRYFDVTIADKHGHQACWRLTNLPQMHHVLAPPLTLQSQVSRQGITIQAHARRYFDRNINEAILNSGLSVTAVPQTLPHQWETIMRGPVMEWQAEGEAPGAITANEVMACKVALGPGGEMGGLTPYAQDLHYVGINAKIDQFETYDETVTFHDVEITKPQRAGYPSYCAVSAPQSVTTPSGITVTLPVVSKDINTAMPWLSGGIDCEYNTSVSDQPTYLAHSPLCREYRRPVTVLITVPKPYHFDGGENSQGSTTHMLSFTVPKPYPAHLASLILIVQQRVELQTLPMHFVVPVEDVPPPVFRPNVSPNKTNRVPGD